MTVPAGIGREAKTPRPGRVNQGISQNRVTSAKRIHHMAFRPLAVLEMRTSPSVLSSGVLWSSDTRSCCIGFRQQKAMSNLSRVLSDIVAYFPLHDTETLEREAVRPFADLDFSSSRRSGSRLQLYLSYGSAPPVVDSSQWQIFPIDYLEFDSTLEFDSVVKSIQKRFTICSSILLTLGAWGFNVVDEDHIRLHASVQR